MTTKPDALFTFRFKNAHDFANRCINCRRSVPANTVHVCEAFTTERAVIEEASIGGFCHCGGFFRGSDHCQCCGCEEHESTCNHICTTGNTSTCTTSHDFLGRII